MKADDLLARIVVVLCRPSHPGNIGAAARAMKTMGLSRLRLVAPRTFPHPEADARAAGAVDILSQASVCSSLPEALVGTLKAVALTARGRDLGPTPLGVRPAVAGLMAAAAEGEVALVFGNETNGLTNDELLCCQVAVTIPADPAFSSLNLGAAVQVMAYELRMAAWEGRPPEALGATPSVSAPATLEEVEGFYSHLEAVMTASGFYNPAQPGRLLPKLRRLFGRAALERDEINILRGILAATQQKTGHGR